MILIGNEMFTLCPCIWMDGWMIGWLDGMIYPVDDRKQSMEINRLLKIIQTSDQGRKPIANQSTGIIARHNFLISSKHFHFINRSVFGVRFLAYYPLPNADVHPFSFAPVLLIASK